MQTSPNFVAHRDRPHVAGNVVSMMVGIEFARDRADLVAPLWKTVRNLADGQLRATVARIGEVDRLHPVSVRVAALIRDRAETRLGRFRRRGD